MVGLAIGACADEKEGRPAEGSRLVEDDESVGGRGGSAGTGGSYVVCGAAGTAGSPEQGGGGGGTATRSMVTAVRFFGDQEGFIAVGSKDCLAEGGGCQADESWPLLLTSADGVAWQERSVPGAGYFTSVAGAAGKYVAVGATPYPSSQALAYVSADGATWSKVEAGFKGSIQDVAFGNGVFVLAFQDLSGSGVYTSSDGVTWLEHALPTAPAWLSFGGGRFATNWATSTDGAEWTPASPPASALSSTSRPSYLGGQFLGFGVNDCCSGEMPNLIRRYFLTSPDGAAWSERPAGALHLEHFTFGAGRYAAMQPYAGVLTSADGLTWEPSPSFTDQGYDVAFGAGSFVAAGYQGLWRSPDGVSWALAHQLQAPLP